MSKFLQQWLRDQQNGVSNDADRDDSNNFVRGVKSSFANLGTTAKAAYGAVTDQEEYLLQAQLDQMKDQKYAGDTQDFTDIDSVGDFGDWLGYQAGNAAGSAAQIVAAGGIGGAAVKLAGKKLGETSLKAMGEKALADLGKKELIGKLDNKVVENLGKAYQKKAAANLQRAGTAGGMLASGLPQHVGESASQMYGETGEIHTGAALVAGTLKASLDMLPIIREFDKFGLAGKAKASITQKVMGSPTRIKRIAKSLGGTMGAEGATEALQDAIGLVALEVINEEKDHFTTAEFKGLFNSFMAGAAGGATFGLPSSLAQAYQSNDPWFKQAAKTREDLKAKAKGQIKTGDTEAYENTTGQLVEHNENVQAEWEDQQAAQEQERELHLQQLEEKQNQRIEQAGINNNNPDNALPTDNQIPFETELPQTLEPPQSDFNEVSQESLALPLDNAVADNEKSNTYPTERVVDEATNEIVTKPIEPSKQQQLEQQVADTQTKEGFDILEPNAGLDVNNQPISSNSGELKTAPSSIDEQANQAAESPVNNLPTPSDKQKEAGNYKKGHVKVHGLDIAIENPKGSERTGTDESGKAWSSTMRSHYGYIKGTVGADKDHLDVFIGKQAEDAKADVYVVDQINPSSNQFDEHKIMMGFADKASAKAGYLENYDKSWKGLGAIKQMPLADFKTWIQSGETKKPLSWKAKESSVPLSTKPASLSDKPSVVSEPKSVATEKKQSATLESKGEVDTAEVTEPQKSGASKVEKKQALDKSLPKPKLNAKVNKMIKALNQSIAKDKRALRKMKCA